jgi:hypothetical protein
VSERHQCELPQNSFLEAEKNRPGEAIVMELSTTSSDIPVYMFTNEESVCVLIYVYFFIYIVHVAYK